MSGDLPRILLVEDNEETTLLIQVLLEDRYDVVTARTASEALAAADRKAFDLALIDINIPGGADGLELFKKLRTRPDFSDKPMAAVTAYAFPSDRKRFLDAGFDDYLSKPFAPEDLLKFIERLLQIRK